MLCIQLDKYYLSENLRADFGYIRSVLVRLEKGSKQASSDKSYVKAVVQHQFRTNSGLPLKDFPAKHVVLLTNSQGKFNQLNAGGQYGLEVTPTSTVERKQQSCSLFIAMAIIYSNANVVHINILNLLLF